MKELTIKIKLMPNDQLKEFEKGRWSRAFLVSHNNFESYYKVNPITDIADIIDIIKKDLEEI